MDEGPEWPPLPRGRSDDSASSGNETASFKCWEGVRVCIPAIVDAPYGLLPFSVVTGV